MARPRSWSHSLTGAWTVSNDEKMFAGRVCFKGCLDPGTVKRCAFAMADVIVHQQGVFSRFVQPHRLLPRNRREPPTDVHYFARARKEPCYGHGALGDEDSIHSAGAHVKWKLLAFDVYLIVYLLRSVIG